MRFNRNFRGRGINSQRTTAQRAIAFLRSLGTSAHVWLPGASGVSVASLASNNYLLSDGSTGYSTVDGVDGLGLDGMGSLGVERITNGDFSNGTTGWTAGGGTTFTVSSGVATIGNNGNTGYAGQQLTGLTVGNTYLITATLSNLNVATPDLRVGTGLGNFNYLLKSGLTAGPISVFHVAAATSAYFGFSTGSVAGVATFDVDNISVKEYTGIHLTQATTANKPLVRRGMFNELIYSNTLSNAAWVTQLTASKSGSNLLLPAVSDNLYQVTTLPAGPLTIGVVMSGTGTVSIFGWNFTQGPFGVTSFTLTSTPTIYAVPLVATGANTTINIGRRAGDTATSVTLDGMGMFKGTWTAAQILAEGGIPTTTATAASNPSAGKYWWSFDGSNDSLLSGNLGITNACTIVIAGRVNALGAYQLLFAEDTNGVQVNISPTGQVFLEKVGASILVNSSAGAIVAGVPFVITARLSGGTAVIRNLGAQVATAASALTFSATTGARVGTAFNGTSYPTGGALGWVVPIAAALSDADCLTVERLVGQQFPGMSAF